MNDFLANKIIEDFIGGRMNAGEAWKNLEESRDIISDEKYDEISALIVENLIESEIVEAESTMELDLSEVFDSSTDHDDDLELDEPYYEGDWQIGGFFDEYE